MCWWCYGNCSSGCVGGVMGIAVLFCVGDVVLIVVLFVQGVMVIVVLFVQGCHGICSSLCCRVLWYL